MADGAIDSAAVRATSRQRRTTHTECQIDIVNCCHYSGKPKIFNNNFSLLTFRAPREITIKKTQVGSVGDPKLFWPFYQNGWLFFNTF